MTMHNTIEITGAIAGKEQDLNSFTRNVTRHPGGAMTIEFETKRQDDEVASWCRLASAAHPEVTITLTEEWVGYEEPSTQVTCYRAGEIAWTANTQIVPTALRARLAVLAHCLAEVDQNSTLAQDAAIQFLRREVALLVRDCQATGYLPADVWWQCPACKRTVSEGELCTRCQMEPAIRDADTDPLGRDLQPPAERRMLRNGQQEIGLPHIGAEGVEVNLFNADGEHVGLLIIRNDAEGNLELALADGTKTASGGATSDDSAAKRSNTP